MRAEIQRQVENWIFQVSALGGRPRWKPSAIRRQRNCRVPALGVGAPKRKDGGSASLSSHIDAIRPAAATNTLRPLIEREHDRPWMSVRASFEYSLVQVRWMREAGEFRLLTTVDGFGRVSRAGNPDTSAENDVFPMPSLDAMRLLLVVRTSLQKQSRRDG